jgi:protein phosphatase
MKIAIISDIHSNLEALKATIENIKSKNVDKIVCLGDIIAKGTHPLECIKLVQENCDIVIQGNCDRHFSNVRNLEKFSQIEQDRIKWNQNMLNKEAMEYLINLPYCYEFYMSGSLVRLFHSSPIHDDETVLNLSSLEEKFEIFKPSEKTISDKTADVVIYGHIHHPYLDRLYNKTLINVGSVGNSFDVIRNDEKDSNILETTKSNYLIIEGEFGEREYGSEISFQFVRVSYDVEKELSDEKFNLEKEGYIYELKQGKYRDMKKVNESFEKLGIKV